MQVQDLIDFQEQIHTMTVEKGFWDDGKHRNRGEMVMLIISELSEAVEAHRKDRIANIKGFLQMWWEDYRDNITYNIETLRNFEQSFTVCIKDSISDEISDTVIRILDYCKGWDFMIYERDYRKQSTGNFANDVLRLTYYCLGAYHNETGKDWGYLLAAIIKFCEWYNIDLIQHVEWKLLYNSTRPHKHNKKY